MGTKNRVTKISFHKTKREKLYYYLLKNTSNFRGVKKIKNYGGQIAYIFYTNNKEKIDVIIDYNNNPNQLGYGYAELIENKWFISLFEYRINLPINTINYSAIFNIPQYCEELDKGTKFKSIIRRITDYLCIFDIPLKKYIELPHWEDSNNLFFRYKKLIQN